MKGHLIGIVTLEKEYQRFAKGEITLALTLLKQASITIDNVFMYEKMKVMAIVDELTGMYKRRYFYEMTTHA
ncbi:GGDEF domain-containing protein [Metabacillus malikii]|uniref:GGDEF domain-containing protein n=2 Tax=Metabacillus malikii TaxID=1504265 RepID=A0ABT9ZHH3_9BACI|nr:GGDEF domain-containing protein [Metabacillus malikii]